MGLGGASTDVSKETLQKAASWAADGTWALEKYSPIALRPVLETLKGERQNLGFSRRHYHYHVHFFPIRQSLRRKIWKSIIYN